MEKPGQSTALRAQFSPAVVALTAVRSRRVLSMPDVLKAGFKDSTATVTWIGHFHGAGLPNSQTKSARASSLTDPAPAGVSAQSPGSIPTVPPVQRPDTQRPDPKAAGSRDLAAFLDDSAALLDSARVSAAGEARLFGFVEAADFAGEVEEIARSVEYLQVVAAQAVERTRTEAQQTKPGPSAATPQWRTGWTEPEPGTDTAAASQSAASQRAASQSGASLGRTGTATAAATDGETGSARWASDAQASVLDDGYRNAAQFLRARLRIGIGE
ncbi:HNH endonuclease, partial [Paenarthrobacter sp. CCNWLY172]